MRNLTLFLLLLSSGIFLTACNKDDDHNDEIIIEFIEPSNDEVVATPANVNIHIRVTAEDEVEEVEIVMHPEEDGDDLIIDQEAHSHESVYEFEQTYDLSQYASGTRFHLEVKVAKDHEGTEFEEKDIHFSIP